MSTSKILIAGIVSGVVYFFLGWIVYGMLLSGFMEGQAGSATGVYRGDDEMIWWALILGSLLYGLLFAYIFGHWTNITLPVTGAKAGAVIGLLVGASIDFMIYATTHITNLTGTLVDVLAYGAMSAVVGAVAAWMLGRGK